jgi:hypothetical protein
MKTLPEGFQGRFEQAEERLGKLDDHIKCEEAEREETQERQCLKLFE